LQANLAWRRFDNFDAPFTRSSGTLPLEAAPLPTGAPL
jgi:hypothetical protein